MLIKLAILKRIKTGEVTLAFRRWRRPTVKSGGTLRTAVGELSITRVVKTTVGKLTARDARCAGYATKAALLADLAARSGDCYRIEIAYAGLDRRMHLRDDDDLDEHALAGIVNRLARMDARSPAGPWTISMLAAVKANPKRVSTDLAARLGVERHWLKASIRKLKNLGLTISHECGYTLSSRGKRVLRHLASGKA